MGVKQKTAKARKYLPGCSDCRREKKEAVRSRCFVDELRGVAAVGILQRSLAEHARALRVMIEEEARKPFPNNHLIAVLIDAACLGNEYCDLFEKRLAGPKG